MTRTAGLTTALLATLALAVAGCGSSGSNAANFATPTTAGAVGTPAGSSVNGLALVTGSPTQQITETIQAFYRATWENDGSGACGLFSSAGVTGFMAAAKIAFPGSVNSVTTCAQAMTVFNASIASQVSSLQDDDVNVDGNALEQVGVSHIAISGDTATAQAPEGVGVLITPKLVHLVRLGGRWLINSSTKLGKTLPQIVASTTRTTASTTTP